MKRPYISSGIQELEKLFADHQADTGVLKQLQAELACRTTDRAARLRERVEERLRSIAGTANQGDFFDGSAAGLKSKTSTDQKSTDEPSPVSTVMPPSVERKRTTGSDDLKGMTADAAAPDDRRRPSRLSHISAPGVRGKPDPFQPALDTDVVLKVPTGAPRAVRYALALDALVGEMRRKGSGQKRYELENGRVVDHQAGQNIYAFAFNEDATIFEDAEVEIEIEKQRAKGQIVSITPDTLLIAIAGEFGADIARCALLIDDTALLVALKERLEQAQKGEIRVDLGLANSVVERDQRLSDVQALVPSAAQLNPAQQGAVRHLLERKVAFLWGPPGSGKTETLSVVVQSAFAAEKRVLICSNTNQAVDQVLLKLCRRLEAQQDPAMLEGRILRLGQIVNNELRDNYSAYVTLDGILDRLSRDLKVRQAEIEEEIALIDKQADRAKRLLEFFVELDRQKEALLRSEEAAEETASRGKAAVAARDKANQQAVEYEKELTRRKQAGAIKSMFMRPEEQIRADLARSVAEAASQDEIARQVKRAFDDACRQKDSQAGQVARLADAVAGFDRTKLQANKAAIDGRRTPLVSELREIARKLADLEANILRNARVIGTTVAKSYLRAKEIGGFDLVVIDEASMVLLPALYLVAGLATERVIVSGDFRQLPPIIDSRQQAIHDEIGGDVFSAAGIDDKPDPRCAMLNLQYRMAEPICGLIAGPMYQNKLKTIDGRVPRPGPLATQPIDRALTIVDTSKLWPFESRNAFHSRFNLLHALLIRNLALLLKDTGFIVGGSDLGICTPYAAQAKLLRGMLVDHRLDGLVAAGTVHRYQGDEKRMLILDVPESIGGNRSIGLFIQGVPPEHVGARIINVAASRAQEYLVVIANLTYLEDRLPSTAQLRHILYDIQEKGKVIEGTDILSLRPIDSDLKRLLGITEIAFDSEKLGMFDSYSFSRACPADMSRAKKSIVIFSGFVTPERAGQYGDLIRAKRAEGVAVRCVTRPPRFNGTMPSGLSRDALDALEAAGAVVDCRRDIHEKVVLIDSRIIWSGSLNPLSHTSRTDEFMTRAEGQHYAEQVAGFLSKRPWVSLSAAAASVAEPENPRCPRCGGRTYFADTRRYGPYFFCEEDACGWGQKVGRGNGSIADSASEHPEKGPPCPNCQKPTRLRSGAYGPFYGCTAYPKCNGIVKISSGTKRSGKRNPKQTQHQACTAG
jgi:AAA domain/PLD-like domain